MRITTIGELRTYIENLPDNAQIQHKGDGMYPEIIKGIFYF